MKDLPRVILTRSYKQCISHHQKMKKKTEALIQDADSLLSTTTGTTTALG